MTHLHLDGPVNVQRVQPYQARKTYLCPGCNQDVAARASAISSSCPSSHPRIAGIGTTRVGRTEPPATGACAVSEVDTGTPSRPDIDPRRFAMQRATVADGLELAYVREGVGGVPAAAPARLAGDQADLVAQHRAAGRRRLRGDRARPPRLRRLRPRARRLLRHRRHARTTSTRSCTTSSATSAARPPAATSAGWSSRTWRCAVPGFVAQAVPLQHGPADPADAYAAAGVAARPRPAPAPDRRLLPPPGRRRRRARRRARHARAAPARTWPSSTATGSGPRRARSTPDDVDVHDRAVRRRRQAAGQLGRLRGRALGNAGADGAPRLFERNPVPTLVLYGPEDHVDLAQLPRPMRGGLHRVHRAVRRARAPATSSSGSARTAQPALIHFFADLR